ncbi:hypothetical protein NPIL_303191, partial [Nephila pilipes]
MTFFDEFFQVPDSLNRKKKHRSPPIHMMDMNLIKSVVFIECNLHRDQQPSISSNKLSFGVNPLCDEVSKSRIPARVGYESKFKDPDVMQMANNSKKIGR